MGILEILGVVAVCAFLNRFAGGGWPGYLWDEHRAGKLPGRALYPATLGVFLAAAALLPWAAALAAGIGFALWRSPAWGYLVSLGHDTPGTRRGPSTLEAFCLSLASPVEMRERFVVALMLRHAIAAAPMFLVLGWIASPWAVALLAPFAILAGLAYAAGWRMKPRLGKPLRTAEIAVGALWGIVILSVGRL